MKKRSILLLLMFCAIITLSAQNETLVFNLNTNAGNGGIVNNSLYNNISFYDSRDANQKELVKIDSLAFSNELDKLISTSINKNAKDTTLVLQIRDLDYYNTKGGVISHLRMTMYAKTQSNYYFITTKDVNISAQDNNKLDDKLSKNIVDFVYDNLNSPFLRNMPYTLEDLDNIDSNEKQMLKVYNVNRYQDGVYPTYSSFANQVPTSQIKSTNFSNNELKDVKDSQSKKITPSNVYAVVVNGKPYVSTGKIFVPLIKKGYDFYFASRDKKFHYWLTPSLALAVGSGAGTGIGYGINSGKHPISTTFVIDHLTGNFNVVGPQ